MNNLYQISKQVHRIAMFTAILITAVMTISGLFMKYSKVSLKWGVDLTLMRELHSSASIIFVITFLIMIFTGMVMYIAPLRRTKRDNN